MRGDEGGGCEDRRAVAGLIAMGRKAMLPSVPCAMQRLGTNNVDIKIGTSANNVKRLVQCTKARIVID